jgi:AmmeMemoRadiSam system protein B/AmmeMemoRadiSam system protein A
VAASDGRGFYTSDAKVLTKQLDGFLAAKTAQNRTELAKRDLVALVAPHAGYQYSGPTAAAAYGQLRGRRYGTVVVLAFSHQRRVSPVALLDAEAYETPLGRVPVDQQVIEQLLVEGGGELVRRNEAAFRGEHSLEMQLPFLQRVLTTPFRIVPVMVASGDEGLAARLAELLYRILGSRRDVLFVASTDLSHHHPYEEAMALDRTALALLTDLDTAGFRQRGPLPRQMPCGYFPLLTLMELVRRYPEAHRQTTLLQYQNSGDTAGDRQRVVGYGAVAYSLAGGLRYPAAASEAVEVVGGFSRSHRAQLTDLARQSVAAAVQGRPFSPPRPADEVLSRPGAAFVTLRCATDDQNQCVARGEELRGCIGHVVAKSPLYSCVLEVARNAALHDRRFPRLTAGELPFVSYELSLLTPPQPVTEPTAVEVGRDGLIMSQGPRRGLLLPQVPIEWGWTRQQFLQQTCRKARLPLDCWRDSRTAIERFTAIVWGEDLAAHERHQ